MEDDRNEEYGKNGSHNHRRLQTLCIMFIPKLNSPRRDIVRYFNKMKLNRNCGVYLVHNEQIVNLCLEDGFMIMELYLDVLENFMQLIGQTMGLL